MKHVPIDSNAIRENPKKNSDDENSAKFCDCHIVIIIF